MSEKKQEAKKEEYVLVPRLKAALQEMSKEFDFKAYATKGKVTERSTVAARLGKHAILLMMPARNHVVVKIPVSGKSAKRIPVDSVTKFNELKGKIRDLMKEAQDRAAQKAKPKAAPKKAASAKEAPETKKDAETSTPTTQKVVPVVIPIAVTPITSTEPKAAPAPESAAS